MSSKSFSTPLTFHSSVVTLEVLNHCKFDLIPSYIKVVFSRLLAVIFGLQVSSLSLKPEACLCTCSIVQMFMKNNCLNAYEN